MSTDTAEEKTLVWETEEQPAMKPRIEYKCEVTPETYMRVKDDYGPEVVRVYLGISFSVNGSKEVVRNVAAELLIPKLEAALEQLKRLKEQSHVPTE